MHNDNYQQVGNLSLRFDYERGGTMRKTTAIILIILCCSSAQHVFAADTAGAVIVRIPDGATS